MTKQILSAMAVLALLGCGVPAYFDQHPANVRAAADIDPDDDTPAPVRTVEAPVETAPLPTAAVPLAALAQHPAVPSMESPTSGAPEASPPAQIVPARPVMSRAYVSPPPANSIESTSAVPPSIPAEATPTLLESPPPAGPAPHVAYLPPPAATPAPVRVSPPMPPAAAQTVSVPAEDVISTQSSQPPYSAPVQTALGASPPVMASAAASVPVAQASEPLPIQTSPPVPSHDAHCEAVATARAEDAAANGKDDDLQKAVHDGTYADCVAWANAHPGGN